MKNPERFYIYFFVLGDPGYLASWNFFKELEKTVPELLPLKTNTFEPINKTFSLVNPEDFQKDWEETHTVLYRRKALIKGTFDKYYSLVNHSIFQYEVKAEALKYGKTLVRFFRSASLKLNSDISILHTPFLEEHDFRLKNETGWRDEWQFGMFYKNILRKYLPDLYTCMVFGKSYVDMFGIKKILSAPAYKVERPSDNQVYLQLGEDVSKPNYEELEHYRKKVKEHLGNDCFFQSEKGIDYKYTVPNFPPVTEPKGTTHMFFYI